MIALGVSKNSRERSQMANHGGWAESRNTMIFITRRKNIQALKMRTGRKREGWREIERRGAQGVFSALDR